MLFVTVILSLSFSFAQWTEQVVTWNGGSVLSTVFITTGVDTSDWFRIPSGSDLSRDIEYPETLSFVCYAVQTSTTDASEATFTLQLSNDKTYLIDYGTVVDISQADVDTYSDDKIMTDMPLLKFGRLIVTGSLAGGDSIYGGAQFSRDFSN